MTGNDFLLDTNIIVAWLNGESAIANKVDKAHSIYIPVIVSGELFYGAMYSIQVQKNILKKATLIKDYPALDIDQDTAVEYGKIKADLRKKGTPIPENDIWISALALQHGLPVVTRDKHFKKSPGIQVKKW